MSLTRNSCRSRNGWFFWLTRNTKYVLGDTKCMYNIVCLNSRVANCGIDRFIGNSGVATFIEISGVDRFVGNSGVATFIEISGVARLVETSGVDRFVRNSGVARFVGSSSVTRFVETSGVARFVGAWGV